jgi:hypothetical protein
MFVNDVDPNMRPRLQRNGERECASDSERVTAELVHALEGYVEKPARGRFDRDREGQAEKDQAECGGGNGLKLFHLFKSIAAGGPGPSPGAA